MSGGTRIEWAEARWDPLTGCSPVSEGCRNCYAAREPLGRLKNHATRKGLARKNAAGVAKFTGEVRFNEAQLTKPLHWRKPRRIFVCPAGDPFHEKVTDEELDRIFAVMALCPQHIFLVLTKRQARMRVYLSENDMPARVADPGARLVKDGDEAHDYLRWHQTWPLPNVWLGVSIEDQPTADERIPDLLATPAAKRFVSAEPLLGPVDLTRLQPHDSAYEIDALDPENNEGSFYETVFLDWVIVGGESAGKDKLTRKTLARPMHPDWARTLRDQCHAFGVSFFFKQWGEWAPGEVVGPQHRPTDAATYFAGKWMIEKGVIADPDDHIDDGPTVLRVGKKAAGAMLDGREWREVPS
ncbi:DUF5131 family protein [Parvibaculum sp. MBR-TMA-1.3b-4.2]|jgi:protein gp37